MKRLPFSHAWPVASSLGILTPVLDQERLGEKFRLATDSPKVGMVLLCPCHSLLHFAGVSQD